MDLISKELSIRFANADDSDTIKRLKDSGMSYIKENEKLKAKLSLVES